MASIFDWPQIRKMRNDKQFVESVTLLERTAWDLFITVIKNLLGKKKSVIYKDNVANTLKAFKKLGSNFSINVHFCSVTWTDSLIT